MSWADGKHQKGIPNPKSAEGKKLEKIVSNTPALKKLRASSNGEKYNEIVSADNSEEYKANYDKIDLTALRNEKKNYRVKVNGKYIDEDEE